MVHGLQALHKILSRQSLETIDVKIVPLHVKCVLTLIHIPIVYVMHHTNPKSPMSQNNENIYFYNYIITFKKFYIPYYPSIRK